MTNVDLITWGAVPITPERKGREYTTEQSIGYFDSHMVRRAL